MAPRAVAVYSVRVVDSEAVLQAHKSGAVHLDQVPLRLSPAQFGRPHHLFETTRLAAVAIMSANLQH